MSGRCEVPDVEWQLRGSFLGVLCCCFGGECCHTCCLRDSLGSNACPVALEHTRKTVVRQSVKYSGDCCQSCCMRDSLRSNARPVALKSCQEDCSQTDGQCLGHSMLVCLHHSVCQTCHTTVVRQSVKFSDILCLIKLWDILSGRRITNNCSQTLSQMLRHPTSSMALYVILYARQVAYNYRCQARRCVLLNPNTRQVDAVRQGNSQTVRQIGNMNLRQAGSETPRLSTNLLPDSDLMR